MYSPRDIQTLFNCIFVLFFACLLCAKRTESFSVYRVLLLLHGLLKHVFELLAILAESALVIGHLAKMNILTFLPLVIAKCAEHRSVRGSLHTRLGFIVALSLAVIDKALVSSVMRSRIATNVSVKLQLIITRWISSSPAEISND